MSSHHIVREKQEPALFVLELGEFDDELLGQLLEWSPTVIVSQEASEKLLSLNIKIDWVIGEPSFQSLQANIKFLTTTGISPTSKALKFLIENGYPSVNIICNDFNLSDYELFIDKINIVVFYQNKKIYAIQSGYNKWKPRGEKIEIYSDIKNLGLEGLKQIKDQKFETIDSGFIRIKFNAPFIFIGEAF